MCTVFLLLIEGHKYKTEEAVSFVYEENRSQEKTKKNKNEVHAK